MFLFIFGSAHTSILVLSGPIPAKLIVAATLPFAGKYLIASFTLPSYILIASLKFLILIFFIFKIGAPSKLFGGFFVISSLVQGY